MMTLSALNGLSSISALSLSEPEAIAGLVTLGIVATGAAVVLVHQKWEDYEEKKHKAEIEFINRLHKQFLERIEVPGYGDIKGFPPIFKFGPEKDSKSVDSLHYTVDEIRDIGTNLPYVTSVLTSYRQSILDAILKLKEYYLSRKEHKDSTAGVISYLLNVLQTKCLSFEGYDYDTAYLGALTDFIDAYASSYGEKSQHYQRLAPVYTYLLDAKQKLDEHKESRSLEELVDELRTTCLKDSNKLLRVLVKMTVSKYNKDLADTVTLDELRDNFLRRKYTKTEKLGIPLETFDEINLPESVFKDWIIGLADYYLASQTPSSILKETNVLSPDSLFAFSSWAQSILKQSTSIEEDKDKLDEDLAAIYGVFKNSPNFINTKLVGSEKKPKFVVVESPDELINRTEVMANFAHLIHGIISVQAFCTHLLHSIEQLGSIYINDPQHFNEIFSVLDNLCTIVQEDLKINKDAFVTISKANKNTMRPSEELAHKEINEILESVEHMLLNLGIQVKEYKKKQAQSTKTSTKSAVYEMLTVARFFEKMYQIPHSDAKETNNNTFPDKAPVDNSHSSSPVHPVSSEEENDLPESTLTLEIQLNNLSTDINKAILRIQKQAIPDPQLVIYQGIYEKLRILKEKSVLMLNEKDAESDRLDKAKKTYDLTLSLYKTALEFLSRKPEERQQQASTFIKKIQAELKSPENSKFIDRHQNNFCKFIYEHFGFFQTATRNKLSALEQACSSLHIANNN